MAKLLKSLKRTRTNVIAQIVIIALAYFLTGKLGLQLALVNPSATAVWPPTGIALATLLLFGFRIFPAIFIGAFLVNLTTAGTVATSFGIAFGNTLEAVTGAFLVNRFAGGYNAFDKTQDIFRFAVLAAILSTTISATIGTGSLFLGGFLNQGNLDEAWLTWWLGDAGGSLIVTPLIILWFVKRRLLFDKGSILEACLLFFSLLVMSEVVFGGFFPFPYALAYLCIPVLMWIALKRTQAETSAGIFFLCVIATINTLHRQGPFATVIMSPNQSLILLQMFLGTVSVMTLVVSAIVAEQKKVEEIRERLATIVNSSHDAIYSMDLRGVVTTWNRGATKIFGYSEQEMLGKSITKIFPEAKKKELKNIISIVKRGKYMTAYESERKRKDGKVIPVSIAVSPLKDSNGKTVEISKIARDISREKELEKRKDEFISMASHELNTPITGLSIYVQTLAKMFEKKNDQQSVEYLGKMDGQIRRIRHIIRDLLDISRIRLGMLSFHYTRFNMDVLVRETAEVAQYMSKNHKIIVEGSAKKVVIGDRDRISQVLTNLISNARKYSPAGHKIIVKVSLVKKELVVSVQDFGIGIAKKHQQRVFELFYRIQEYHGRTFPGMGIGLYLSFQIIDEHNGRMWFKSQKGKGTTFYFALPLYRELPKN